MINNDCLEAMAGMEDNSIDLILTDPPYGTTRFAWDIKQNYQDLFSNWYRIGKDNVCILIFSQQPAATDVILSCRKYFRYEIIWRKRQKLGFLNAKKMPLRGHENILVFYRKLPTYNPQKYRVSGKNIGRRRAMSNDRYEGYSNYKIGVYQYEEDGTRLYDSVVDFSNWNGTLFGKANPDHTHPTQKPIDLVRWLIQSYSNAGDTVLDCFSGSGTTAISALIENRNCICCEIDPGYYSDSVKRFQNHKAQGQLFTPEQTYKPKQTKLL